MSTLQFPPPPESIELVTQNLLTEQLETPLEESKLTPLEKSKLNRWKSDLHLLTSRYLVLEESQRKLKNRLKVLSISVVCLIIIVTLNTVGLAIGAIEFFVKK